MKWPSKWPWNVKEGQCWGMYYAPWDAPWTDRANGRLAECQRPFGHLDQCGPELPEGRSILVVVDGKMSVVTA